MLKDIVISNLEKLENLKNKISQAGPEKLHVLADFDRTLTKAFVNGEEIPSLISVLRDCNYLTPDYSPKAKALFEKYHKIEIEATIPLEEKKKAMEEWWKAHFELLVKSGLNKNDLKKVVDSERVKFREGAGEFIDLAHKFSIPLIIMSSSGLGGDVIEMYLEGQKKLYDNIYIISNSFEWDSQGKAVTVKEPIIHSMNKDTTLIENFPVFERIKNRKNVLLLGDNIEDIGMVEGFDYENLIKVGFLNKKVEENLDAYKNNFDVVILNDSDMFFVNHLLQEIIKSR